MVAISDLLCRVSLAEGLADVGRIDDGLEVVDQAIAKSERSGIRWFGAESHRHRGEILLKRDAANTAPAEEAFLTAIAIAREQKTRSFELRAARSMARLWRDQGPHDNPRIARSGLRLVHRRLRHVRSEGG